MRKYITPLAIRNKLLIILFCGPLLLACASPDEKNVAGQQVINSMNQDTVVQAEPVKEIIVGAARMKAYLPVLENKRVAIVANQTSLVGHTHLVDTLQVLGIQIEKVFALEHGFRGEVQAGEHVKNDKDVKTGIPIVSLYGSNKKPKAEYMKDIDLIIFDIQDVGARFYTYISSMHYIMEAAAENNKTVIILDRPNPNGFYVDGPVLDMKHKSFVGMHPVPVVHGMTVGEYAQMINGEKWLQNGIQCDLKIITCENYDHNSRYELPVKPSPNLPNMASIYLYPTLCLFEGTNVSVARGTDFPFQAIGMPGFEKGDFVFTPKSVPAAKNPPHKDKACKGYDLREFGNNEMKIFGRINLDWLIDFYQHCPDQKHFFEDNNMFVLLSGTTELKKQLTEGKTKEEIYASWETGLNLFKEIRKKYLLYKDFE